MFVTSFSDEYSCQCFDAFLVPFTAALSLQNRELLIPEGIPIERTVELGKFLLVLLTKLLDLLLLMKLLDLVLLSKL